MVASISSWLISWLACVAFWWMRWMRACRRSGRVLPARPRPRAQRGQRCADLVGGVGHQRVQCAHQAGQAVHEGVQRLDQTADFLWHRRGDGLQIIRRPPSQFALDHGQGREGALHAEPQEAQRHQRHRHQRQHAAAQDLVGQGFARAQRLGHAHRHPAGVLAGGYQPAHGGHAHRFIVIVQIVVDRRGRLRQRQAGRQVAVAGDQPAVRGQCLVEHPFAAGEHGQRGNGRLHGHAVILDLTEPAMVSADAASRRSKACSAARWA